MRTWLARVLVVALLVLPGAGSVAWAQTSNQNTSDGSEAASGDATGSTNASGTTGAQAQTGPGAQQIEGPVSGTIVQEGDNEGEVEQVSVARSGDSVAGSQISGAVVGPGASASINNTNVSEDAEATSGDVSAVNNASLSVGPRVTGDGGCPVLASSIEGPVGACIVQDGDNEGSISQSALAESGDAVAGSQISGVVASGEGTNVSIANDNTSDGDEATSGNADAANNADSFVGPEVVFLGGLNGFSGDAATASITGPVAGNIVQDGDNELDTEQNAESTTGDAVAGGQITGVVASGGADVSVAVTQDTQDGEATSGDSSTVNSDATEVGPLVTEFSGLFSVGTASIDAGGGELEADIIQDGDNVADIAQDAIAATGDAVAGGQIAGGVVDGGSLSIVGDNVSEDAESTSGDALATNVSGGTATNGSVRGQVVLQLAAGARVGPQTIGSSPLCTACGFSISADRIEADIVQDGDNELDLAQTADSATGDAVSGASIIGVVGTGGDIAIDATNSSDGDEATSGDATSTNDSGVLTVGPDAGASSLGITSASIDAGTIAADIVQDGDNDAGVEQDAAAATGDAVAGGQVMGLVGGGDASIVASNESEDAESVTGDATSDNQLAGFETITVDLGGIPLTVLAFESTHVGPRVDGRGAIGLSQSIDAGAINAGIVQDGDNELDLAQAAGSETGDAVAGGQVMGAVIAEGGSVAVDATNSSEDDQATSGDADALNDTSDLQVGPEIESIFLGLTSTGAASISADEAIDAGIVQDGENAADIAQNAGAASGDAVGGGQVFGFVGAGDASLVASNTSEDADSESGAATSENDLGEPFTEFVTVGSEAGDQILGFGEVNVGPRLTFAFGEEGGGVPASIDAGTISAGIVQDGDNGLDLAQDAGSATGDAVAGGQVAGIVTAAGGDVSADLTNSSEDDQATSGTADAFNNIDTIQAGPEVQNIDIVVIEEESIDAGSIAADIVQEGDNDIDAAQTAAATSGDAVGGGQIAGIVSAGSVDLVASSTSEDSDATSGDALSTNDVGGPIRGGFIGDEYYGFAGDGLRAGPLVRDTDITFCDFCQPLSIEAGAIEASIVQEGDNDLGVAQDASSATGDAVAGGQVSGIVASATGAVSADISNESEGAESTSGDSTADNLIVGSFVGPEVDRTTVFDLAEAIEGDIDANIVQDGDNDFDAEQTLDVGSGDAVAGGQVMGIVAGGVVDVTQDNASEDDESTTGNTLGTHRLFEGRSGPVVVLELDGVISIP